MLFSLQKQMDEQQTEMGGLHEAAALKKDSATRVQTRLLK